MFTVSILTVSDKGSQGKREDKSGEAIREIVSQMDARVVDYAIVPDERDIIAKKLTGWADSGKVDMVITTGGTGLAPRDVTPEATLDVIDKIGTGFRRGDESGEPQENAQRYAEPGGGWHPQEDTYHQPARQPESSARMSGGNNASPASRC